MAVKAARVLARSEPAWLWRARMPLIKKQRAVLYCMPMLASVLESGLATFDLSCDGIGDLS